MTTHSAVCDLRVGREAEIALLEAAVVNRTTTLIAGDAGVGKSRLAAEAIRLAEVHGLSRLVGPCTPEPTVPYAPFVSAVRRRTRTMGVDMLATLFDGSAMLAAALLPEAAKAVSLPQEVPAQEDLFAAVWQLLNRLAAPDGCLLLLEDVHWADTDSLRLLAYLARETADLLVWVVATYRTDELHRRHPLAGTLAELGRERCYEEILLAPLRRNEVREMVSRIFEGTDVGDEFLDAVFDRTAGNPFFVEELVKVLVERGDIYREAGDWARRDLADIEMPLTVRETLLARARTLDETTTHTFHLAALAGERIEIPVLAQATALNPAAIEDAVREGLRLQLLTERRDGPRVTYAFRHALTREAFADDLVGPHRQRGHLRIAEALVAVHANDLDAVTTELADHYAEAGETQLAIEFGIRAARRAVASFALDEAARRYDRTFRLFQPASVERLSLLLEASDALIESPSRRLAVAFAKQARDLARSGSNPVAEGRALSALSRDAWMSGDSPQALSLLEEARELVRGRNDAVEALISARLTRMLTLADRHDEAASLLPDGIELALRSENYQALSLMHGTRMMFSMYGSEFEESFQAATAAARTGNDEFAERNLVTNAGYICLWCGDFPRSRDSFGRAMELDERTSPHDRYAEAGYVWLLSLLGEYEDAASRAVALQGAAAIPTRIVALTAMYEIAERRGDQKAGDFADELWAVASKTREAQRSVPAMAARCRHSLLADGVESATPRFWEALTHTTTNRGTGSHWMFSPDLARALADEERVDELQRWAVAFRTLTTADPHRHNEVALVLVDAHLSASSGELATARASFGEAATTYHELPCPAREAEALIGLADLEWRAGEAQVSVAAGLQAVALAERIGATAVAKRATDAVRRAEVRPVLATPLFTDIVSSTEQLSAVGSERGAHSLIGTTHSSGGSSNGGAAGRSTPPVTAFSPPSRLLLAGSVARSRSATPWRRQESRSVPDCMPVSVSSQKATSPASLCTSRLA